MHVFASLIACFYIFDRVMRCIVLLWYSSFFFLLIRFFFFSLFLNSMKELVDRRVTTKNDSICIDCGSNRCCALILALHTNDLYAYSVNSSLCITVSGCGNYSVALFAVGFDGMMESRPLVTEQIATCTFNQENRTGTFSVISSVLLFAVGTARGFIIILCALTSRRNKLEFASVRG